MPDTIIPDKLRRGLLPRDKPIKTWAGNGSGDTCDGCDQPINADQVEHELEFAHRAIHMHARCAEIWRRATEN